MTTPPTVLPWHKAPPIRASRRVPACAHRGETVRVETIVNCPVTLDTTPVPVRSCSLHGECIDRHIGELGLRACTRCPDAADEPFARLDDDAVQIPPPAPPRDTRGFLLDYRGQSADHLADMVRSQSCFLICGGPSLAETPLELLNQRGILTAAVNNVAATHVRPHFWFSVDSAGNFHEAIWRDPAIMKFVRRDRSHNKLRRAGELDRWQEIETLANQCPNAWFYKYGVANCSQGFPADTFLTCSPPVWAGTYTLDNGVARETRSCMLPALRLLYWLGCRTVYLVGADFHMRTEQPYAFPERKGRESCGYNNTTYGVLGHWFTALRPHLDAAGFRVLNATPGSRLTAFPMIDFRDAVARALEGWPAVESVRGMYG